MTNYTDAVQDTAQEAQNTSPKPPSANEQKLAAALRRNLQRRKASGAKRTDSTHNWRLTPHVSWHHESEKHKKQREQRDRNKRNWLIFMQSDQARIKVSIGAPSVQVRNSSKENKKEPKVWSKQLSSIRNRLDNSRRTSDDRFNRFAGTEDGGGRGR